MTVRRTRIFVTIICIVIPIYQFFVTYFVGESDKIQFCANARLFSKRTRCLIFKLPFHILSTITISAYVAIGVFLHRRYQQKLQMSDIAKQRETISNQQKKTIKLLFITAGSFYILYSVPLVIMSMDWTPNVALYLYNACSILVTFNFMINPMIYWQNEDYQNAYRSFLNLKPNLSKRKLNNGNATGIFKSKQRAVERLVEQLRPNPHSKSIPPSTLEITLDSKERFPNNSKGAHLNHSLEGNCRTVSFLGNCDSGVKYQYPTHGNDSGIIVYKSPTDYVTHL